MKSRRLYLSSMESTRFEPVRACDLTRLVTLAQGSVGAVARIDPIVLGQDLNRPGIAEVIVVPRHRGQTIDPVSRFPLFVFIAVPSPSPSQEDESPAGVIRTEDLEILAWGEPYRTRYDAEHHVIGEEGQVHSGER